MKKIGIFSLFLFIISACETEIKNDDVTIIDDSIASIIDKSSKIEIIADSLIVSEGPLWDENSKSLIFTDVAQNKMFRWNEKEGVQDFIQPSGYTGYSPAFEKGLNGANGIAYNKSGDIVICQHGDRRVALIANQKTNDPIFTTIIDNYDGKRFNSPNDLSIASNGDIYFTDPPYGFFQMASSSFDNRYKELEFNGVFKLSNEGDLTLVSKEMSIPNGIVLSLDEKYVYVNNSDTEDPKIMKFDTENFQGELFFDGKELTKKYQGGFDGLKVHSSGNIFSTGPNGILIISPKGDLLGTINFGGGVTNCNFDTNEEYLYVTAFSYVARIKLK